MLTPYERQRDRQRREREKWDAARPPLWSGFHVNAALEGALRSAKVVDRPPPPYFEGRCAGFDATVWIAERVRSALTDREREAIDGALARRRGPFSGERLKVRPISPRADGLALAEMIDGVSGRAHSSFLLNKLEARCAALAVRLLYEREAGRGVYELCAALDQALLRHAVAFETVSDPRKRAPFAEAIAFVHARGTALLHGGPTNWAFVTTRGNSGEMERESFIRRTWGAPETWVDGELDAMLAEQRRVSPELAEDVEIRIAVQSAVRAFFTGLPDRAPVLAGSVLMIAPGQRSFWCDYCGDHVSRRRGRARNWCPACKATIEAARAGRYPGVPMLLAELDRVLVESPRREWVVRTVSRLIELARSHRECPGRCGRAAGDVLTRWGGICAECAAPRAPTPSPGAVHGD